MSLHRFDVIIGAASGILEDAIVNTWHFNGGVGVTDYDNVRDMLANFYTAPPMVEGSGTSAICSFFATDILAAGAQVKAYDLSDPEPRVPVYVDGFVWPFLGTENPLPQEVALVFSFSGFAAAGVAQASRRNRKYLGPFTVASVFSNGRPTALLQTTIAGAGRRLLEESAASVSWDWMWYSPTTSDAEVPEYGWVDDSWDTQRRRGVKPANRNTFNAAEPADA